MPKGIKRLLLIMLLLCPTGCGKSAAEDAAVSVSEKNSITIGFSQLGAESDWRSANTESVLGSFPESEGYTLLYENGQQKQSNQITALRTFIQQEVNYIVLAPVTESGWDIVLEEAKEAGIPVIIMDRRVDVVDRSLYDCWIGSDFEMESRKICAWLDAYTRAKNIRPSEVNIVHIQGTIGSTAQIGRTRGLNNAARTYGWNVMAQMSGDFTQTKGRDVMAAYLERFDDINVVFCENDNEAIGAIEAIEAAGLHAGPDIRNGDILVLSFDGISEEALGLAAEGKIACIAECNPDHGPRLKEIIAQLEAGETPEKFNYVDERIFTILKEVTTVTVDGETYPVDDLTNIGSCDTM